MPNPAFHKKPYVVFTNQAYIKLLCGYDLQLYRIATHKQKLKNNFINNNNIHMYCRALTMLSLWLLLAGITAIPNC